MVSESHSSATDIDHINKQLSSGGTLKPEAPVDSDNWRRSRGFYTYRKPERKSPCASAGAVLASLLGVRIFYERVIVAARWLEEINLS